MNVLESDLSTSGAASEMIDSKAEVDRITNGSTDDHAAAPNAGVEPIKEEKKSFKFKLTVFMLCFVSVVVAMVGPPIAGRSRFERGSLTQVCRTRSSSRQLCRQLQSP